MNKKVKAVNAAQANKPDRREKLEQSERASKKMSQKANKKSLSKKSTGVSNQIQTQLRNINEDFAQSLNLPENSNVHATLLKKSSRQFETKIEVSLWRESIFCKATAETPEASLALAKRKMTRLVSDLHDRKFASKKHMKPNIESSIERQLENDIRAL